MHSHSTCIWAVTGTPRRNWLRRFLTSCGGAVAVEFTLLVPVFLLILFATAATSSVLFVQNGMENGAREAARLVAVKEVPNSGAPTTCAAATPGSAEAYACNVLTGWVTTYTILVEEPVCIGGAYDPDRNVVVTVSAAGSEAALADIYRFFTGVNLEAKVTMRMEPRCV